MTLDQELFELIQFIGEGLYNKIHIIDSTGTPESIGDQSFRVYHSGGYCFDIETKMIENENNLWVHDYIFISEFDGFKLLTTYEAIKLIMKEFKIKKSRS